MGITFNRTLIAIETNLQSYLENFLALYLYISTTILSVLIIVNIFVRISKTNWGRRQNGERYSRGGKSAAKYRLKDCQYSSRPFLHHLPFCRRKRNFLEKERENEEGIRGKGEFFVFSFPSCHSSLYLPIYRPPPSRPFSLFCRTSPLLEINYSTFFSHHYTPAANNQGTRFGFFFEKRPSLSVPLARSSK